MRRLLWLMLMVAAIAGNETNFRIGRAIGPRAFSGHFRWLKKEYLDRTQAFYDKHGGKTIVLVTLHPHHPHVRAVRRRRRLYEAQSIRSLITWRRISLGDDLHLGRLPVRQRAADQKELRRRDDCDHRHFGDAGGLGAAQARQKPAGA